MGVEQVILGHELHQFILDLDHILAGRDAGAVADSKNVGVHGHRQLAECSIEHNVGGLATNARQGFQFFAGLRHFTGMTLNQQAAGLDHVFCLAVVQADGLDVFRQSFDPQGMNRRRSIGNRKQFCRGLVHADIGRLRGKNHRNQQFKG
ncbi:hypothetical protein D3C84_609400 [compost metagenome]